MFINIILYNKFFARSFPPPREDWLLYIDHNVLVEIWMAQSLESKLVAVGHSLNLCNAAELIGNLLNMLVI